MNREPAVYRPMTDTEHTLALALARCTLPVASFVKRFARDLRAQAEVSRSITDRQARQLLIQAYRFRRQFPAAHRLTAPPEGYETPGQREQRYRYEMAMKTHPPAAPAETHTAQPNIL